jgi:hypothetical protein
MGYHLDVTLLPQHDHNLFHKVSLKRNCQHKQEGLVLALLKNL